MSVRPQPPARTRARIVIGTAILLAGLTGCSALSSFSLDSINIFREREEILPGDRLSIITATDPLVVDPQAANVPPLPAERVNTDWAQPGGLPTNSAGHLAFNPFPKRAWSTRIGRGSRDDVRLSASPIVYQGQILTMGISADVSAVSLSGGKGWSVSLRPEDEDDKGILGGGLAADGGMIFAATGYGTVSALDPNNGARLWTKDMKVPIRSAPTAADGRVFIVSSDNKVHVLAAADGTELWSYRGIPEATGLIANTSPAVSGNLVVVPFSSGEVMAFKAVKGEPVWADSLTRTQLMTSLSGINDVAARPVIDAGRVYAVSVSGRMVAVNEKTGERIWTRNISSTQAPAVAGETVYVVSMTGQLAALARDSGKVRWLLDLPGDRGVSWNGPVLAGGQLWLSSSTKKMVSVNALIGQISGQYELGAASHIAPILASGSLLLLLNDGSLVAFN